MAVLGVDMGLLIGPTRTRSFLRHESFHAPLLNCAALVPGSELQTLQTWGQCRNMHSIPLVRMIVVGSYSKALYSHDKELQE